MIRVNEIKSAAQKGGRDVFFAGLGVFSVAQETARKTFGNLVDKGREARPEKKEAGAGALEKSTTKVKEMGHKVTETIERNFQNALAAFGLPNAKEVGTLSDRIQALTEKVNQMIPAAKKA